MSPHHHQIIGPMVEVLERQLQEAQEQTRAAVAMVDRLMLAIKGAAASCASPEDPAPACAAAAGHPADQSGSAPLTDGPSSASNAEGRQTSRKDRLSGEESEDSPGSGPSGKLFALLISYQEMMMADSAGVRSIEELLERLAGNPTPMPPHVDPAGVTQVPVMPIKPIPWGQPIQTVEIRRARQVMEQRLARLLAQAAELIEKLKGGESA